VVGSATTSEDEIAVRARQATILSVLAALVAGLLVGGTPASANSNSSEAIRAYVTKVYSDLFGRAPDPTGLSTWTNALQTGTPYTAVANSITASREFRSGLINQSYGNYLGRGPDSSGLENWLTAMNQGMQIEQMQAGFITSPEFIAASNGTDGWITRLYQTVLGRSPAPSEVNSWATALARGTSRTEAATGFLYSTERLTTVVNGYYLRLLGRGIDSSGAQSWVAAIQAGARDEQIIAGIVASDEYRRIAAPPAQAPAPQPPVVPSPPLVVTPPLAPPVVSPPSTGGRPGATNTGVPAGTALTVANGDIRVTTPNTVIDSMDIRGFVVVAAPGVVIKNSIIRGANTDYDRGLVMVAAGSGSVTIQDSELAPTTESYHIRGIIGANFTLTRVNIHHVIDQALITGDNVTIQNSWFHDNSYWAQDPNYNNTPSHNDNIQISIGKNLRFVNNTLTGTKNAVMMVTQDRGTVTDLQFNGNYADGGACSVNLAEKSYGPLRGLSFKDNVFGRNTRVADCAIIAPDTTAPLLSLSNNVYTDGKPVVVHKG
jgi:hypothetical protein